jgi:hypothetical protein
MADKVPSLQLKYMYEKTARTFLGASKRPAIVFLTVRTFCKHDQGFVKTYAAAATASRRSRRLLWPGEWTPFSQAESWINTLCTHYQQSCISYHEAVSDGILSRRVGFSLSEVALDCLHPLHGSRGTDYMADMLIHWLDSARRLSTAGLLPMPGSR